jgi:hypothetical protein
VCRYTSVLYFGLALCVYFVWCANVAWQSEAIRDVLIHYVAFFFCDAGMSVESMDI